MTLPNRLASVALQRSESSAASELESPAFSLREVTTLVQGLFPPKPSVYWGDLFLSVFLAYGLAAVYHTAPAFAWIQVGALVLSGLALFLAGTFTEAPRSKLQGITELNFEDFSEAEANPVASYGECSSSRNRLHAARLHDGVSCGVERPLWGISAHALALV